MNKEQKDLGADAAAVESAEQVASDPASHVAHTPGSWVVHHDSDDWLYRVVLDDSGPGQCVIAELETQQEEYANAHLIAAAPELLAVAREARRIHVCCCGPHDASPCLRCTAAAAIAKAEGKV